MCSALLFYAKRRRGVRGMSLKRSFFLRGSFFRAKDRCAACPRKYIYSPPVGPFARGGGARFIRYSDIENHTFTACFEADLREAGAGASSRCRLLRFAYAASAAPLPSIFFQPLPCHCPSAFTSCLTPPHTLHHHSVIQ